MNSNNLNYTVIFELMTKIKLSLDILNNKIDNSHCNQFRIVKPILKWLGGKTRIIDIILNIEPTINLSDAKTIELRALSLFQNINSLGNYSDSAWFLSLNRIQLIKFVRELSDIWNYRLQITDETKRNICPPHGDPFRNINMSNIYSEPEINIAKKVILELLEKFVNTGVDTDSKSLGAYYVLGALTIVNNSAATSIPWLFQSFAYFQNM